MSRTEEDVRCDDCGIRSRAGYALPVEPCWAGGTSDSGHDWVPTDPSDDGRDDL